MRIPVVQGFGYDKLIGYLVLEDDLEIPRDAVFALTYEQAYKDGKPVGKIQVRSVSLYSDLEYLQYVFQELRSLVRRSEEIRA